MGSFINKAKLKSKLVKPKASNNPVVHKAIVRTPQEVEANRSQAYPYVIL